MVEKRLNIEQLLIENLFKLKLKFIGEFGHPRGKVGWVGFNEGDLEIFRLEVWEILNFE